MRQASTSKRLAFFFGVCAATLAVSRRSFSTGPVPPGEQPAVLGRNLGEIILLLQASANLCYRRWFVN
jgi:hypothetical protein